MTFTMNSKLTYMKMLCKPTLFPTASNVILRNISRGGNLKKTVPLEAENSSTESHSDLNSTEIPKYIRLNEDSNILGQYMAKIKSRKMREKSKLILLEGKRLIQDALDAGAEPEAIFFSRLHDLQTLGIKDKPMLYRAPYKLLQTWSDVQTSQGVVGIFKTPDTAPKESKTGILPLTIICDNVRDPGNLGSILRTAAACGCQQILLTKGCVDLWESKVLRSASGAHFRLCIVNNVSWDEVSNKLPSQVSVLLADLAMPTQSNRRTTTFQKHLEPHLPEIPIVPYFNPQYKYRGNLVLVLGGETEGLSPAAFQLATDKAGVRVYIPLENGVESLNSGTALGIICYEIRRQLLDMTSVEKFSGVGLYTE